MPHQNSAATGAKRLSGSHEFRVFQRKNLTSHDATESEPASEAEEDDESADGEMRPRNENPEQQQQTRDREKSIEQAHHERVRKSAGVTGDCPIGDAQRQADNRRKDADCEREPRAVDDPTQDVSTIGIGPKRMRERWW